MKKIKEIIEIIKEFIKKNGITSVGFLAAWLILWLIFGMGKVAFIFLGVFLCKNWFIVQDIWRKKFPRS